MKDLSIFNFENKEVRIVLIDNEPWFVAVDICSILEHSNTSMALSRIDEDEKGISIVYTLGGEQSVNIINESGLYSLVLTSRKPEAKRFKKWITSEVLPAIRKTGSYSISLTPTQMLLKQCELMVEHERRLTVTEERVKRIEAKQQAFEEGVNYFTVIGYSVWKGLPAIDLKSAAHIGRIASKLSQENGVLIDKVHDPRFGMVNSYHSDILEQAIQEFMGI